MNKLKDIIKFHIKYWVSYIVWPILIYFSIDYLGQKFDINELKPFIKLHILKFIMCILIVCIISRKLLKKIRKSYISDRMNRIDFTFMECTICTIGLLYKYRNIPLAITLIVIIIFEIYRWLFIIKECEKEYRSNIVWLTEVYDNTFYGEDSQILIREEESPKDLCNKEKEIKAIASAIINCRPDTTFTIGIDGKWNKGKSTTIKFVKEKVLEGTDDILIVEFDPCKYDSSETMLTAFYNNIAEKLGIKEWFKYRKLLRSFVKDVISGQIKMVDFDSFFEEFFFDSSVNELICDELKNSRKRLLIIVDNLDRADTEIVRFFLRCTYSITKFTNTIFLIIYDSVLLNKQLSRYYNTDNLFMNKIVNLPIIIPENDKEKINNVFNVCLNNLVMAGYIEKIIDDREIDFYDDFREVIRALNYLLYNSLVIKKLKLNMYDLLGLLYIREHEPNIYDEIFDNYNYLTYGQEYEYNVNQKEKNETILNKLDELYKKINNEECKRIICEMFTIMKDFSEDNGIRIQKLQKIKGNVIENNHYFHMYFYMNTTKYFEWDERINKQIEELSDGNNEICYKDFIVENIIKEDNPDCRGYIAGLIRDKYSTHFEPLSMYLVCKQFIINESEAASYLRGILLDSFNKLKEEDLEKELSYAKNDYKNIWFYRSLANPYIIEGNRAKMVDTTITDICDEIYKNFKSINMLTDENFNYESLNIMSEKNGKAEFNQVMQRWLNKDTVINYIRYKVRYAGEDFYTLIGDKEDENYSNVVNLLNMINIDKFDTNIQKRIKYYKEECKYNNNMKLM